MAPINGALFSTNAYSAVIHTTNILDPVTLIIIGAILPIISYPFLTDADRGNGPALLIPPIVQLVGFHLPNWCCWLITLEYYDVPLWLAPLQVCAAAAGVGWVYADEMALQNDPESSAPAVKDFGGTAWCIIAVLCYLCFRMALWLNPFALFSSPHSSGMSLLELVDILVLATAIALTAVLGGRSLHWRVMVALHRFTTRQFDSWFWLRDKEEFGPVWSKVLTGCVVYTPPLSVGYIMLISLARLLGSEDGYQAGSE